MQIAIIGLWQESNSFAPHITTEEMAKFGISRGDQILTRYKNSNSEIGGFIEVLNAHNIEIIPIIAMHVAPAGPMASPLFNSFTAEVVQSLEENPVDGVLLCMHGSTVAENEADVCGRLASMIRQTVGHKPIITTLDMHANPMPLLIDSVNAAVCYKTNPHVDFKARGKLAADLIVRTVKGEIDPVMAWSGIPMSTWGNTSLLQALIAIGKTWEESEDVLAVSACATHMPLDVAGRRILSAMVVTDAHPEKARDLAKMLMKKAWSKRGDTDRLDIVAHPLPEAVQKALACPSGPVALIDWSDSITQGWPGDDPSLVKYVIEQDIPDPVCTLLHDPEVVAEALAAGVGKTIQIELGGVWGGDIYQPFATEARVRGLFDGQIWPKASIWADDLGPLACLKIENVVVVVSSIPVAVVDPNVLASVGVDYRQYRLIQVKSNTLLADDLVDLIVIGGPRNEIAAMPWTQVDPTQVYPFRLFTDEEMLQIIEKGVLCNEEA